MAQVMKAKREENIPVLSGRLVSYDEHPRISISSVFRFGWSYSDFRGFCCFCGEFWAFGFSFCSPWLQSVSMVLLSSISLLISASFTAATFCSREWLFPLRFNLELCDALFVFTTSRFETTCRPRLVSRGSVCSVSFTTLPFCLNWLSNFVFLVLSQNFIESSSLGKSSGDSLSSSSFSK